MGIADDISLKRQLLAAFRMRLAPEVQQAKEAVVDSLVEHVLFATEADVGTSIDEIKEQLNKTFRVNILNRDLSASTQRLMERGRVESYEEAPKGVKLAGKKKKEILYKLTAAARKEIKNSERETINRFDSVCKRLFKYSKIGWKAYLEPFLKFLSFVFSKLAEENIRMIRGDMPPGQVIKSPAFSSALNSIKPSLKSLDVELFESAAISFFRDPDPDYAAIKWNMAQNYYVLKVIGLDEQALLLSRDVFKNAHFYLDTNVVISALEPQESHHKTFLKLCEVCQRLGIEVNVCNITLEELDRVVIAHRDMLKKVVDQIPEETAVKVSSDFYEVYHEKKKSGEVFDLDAIFDNFSSAGDKLKDYYKIETCDTDWFDRVKDEGRTSDFAGEIAERYANMRKRKKNEAAANHDSLCLLWIEEVRQSGNDNSWFVTRDHTLPGCVPKDCDYKSLAITMDALIQWLLPVDTSLGEEKDVALAYSEMISSRILPQERIFNL
jgi:predicted nucleic acid-binding protein